MSNLTTLLTETATASFQDEGPSDICGANFCPGTVTEAANPNLHPPETSKINLITGIYLACMIGACLVVAIFVDPVKRYGKGRKGSGTGLSGFKLLAVTVKQLASPYQILILPITMFIGAEQAFIAADFNAMPLLILMFLCDSVKQEAQNLLSLVCDLQLVLKERGDQNCNFQEFSYFLSLNLPKFSAANFFSVGKTTILSMFSTAYVSCGWGISSIGFVMICFGICNGIAAIFIGSLIKITGRSPVICFALSLHVALIVTLLVWQPTSSNKLVFFVISALWGICDAVWLVQINSLSGILFPGKEEASYSNFRLWESTGSVITYAYSPYLCTDVKLYLLLGLLLIGASGYTVVEYQQYKLKNVEKDVETKGKFELVHNNVKSGEVAE